MLTLRIKFMLNLVGRCITKLSCLFSFGGVIVSVLGCQPSGPEPIALVTAKGGMVIIDSEENKPIFVNFWAEWCGPCKKEVPELNAMQNAGVATIVGIDFDQQKGESLKTSINKMGIQFPVVLDEAVHKLNLSWPEALPVTILLKNGVPLVTLHGPQTQEELNKLIQQHF